MRETHSRYNPHILELAVYDHCSYFYLVHIRTEYEPNRRLRTKAIPQRANFLRLLRIQMLGTQLSISL